MPSNPTPPPPMNELIQVFGFRQRLPRLGDETWLLRWITWRSRLHALLSGRLHCQSLDILIALIVCGSEAVIAAALEVGPNVLPDLYKEALLARAEPPSTRTMSSVLTSARDHSVALGHRTLSSEHILLALAKDERLASSQLLASHRLTYELLREFLSRQPVSPHTFSVAFPTFYCQIHRTRCL